MPQIEPAAEPLPRKCSCICKEGPLWHSHNPMATTLAPVDSREVVRCDHCLLVQFRTSNNNCRRCHASLDEEPEPEPISVVPPLMMPVPGTGTRASELGDLHPLAAPAQRIEPAATGRANGGSPHLRLEDRKRKGHAYAVFPGTAGACTGGYCARTAQRRRTQPSGGNQRVGQRSIYRRTLTLRFATKWDADVQHPDSGARLDRATEKERVEDSFEFQVSSFGNEHSPIRIAIKGKCLTLTRSPDSPVPETRNPKLETDPHDFYPGNQPTLSRDQRWSRFFPSAELSKLPLRGPHLSKCLRNLRTYEHITENGCHYRGVQRNREILRGPNESPGLASFRHSSQRIRQRPTSP